MLRPYKILDGSLANPGIDIDVQSDRLSWTDIDLMRNFLTAIHAHFIDVHRVATRPQRYPVISARANLNSCNNSLSLIDEDLTGSVRFGGYRARDSLTFYRADRADRHVAFQVAIDVRVVVDRSTSSNNSERDKP